MTNLSPQARRRAQTRQDIIENARLILMEQGMAGLSIRALADSIDYTPGALYKYFDSKETLIDVVRAECFDRLNNFIAARIQHASSAAEMLLTGGMAYIEYAGQHPQEYHLMFNMEPSRATAGEQREQAMRSLLQIVQLGLQQGEFAPQEAYDAAAITYHCWATVHGIASLRTAVLLNERDDLLVVSRIILQKVIDGFTV
ncbi:MAG: TetR/AcrR family transcriptional regulator [Anaerolineales bacterium]|nr:TetR/AcrR family transcriptional regulator [Anaerolineales bacterium]MCB8990398.1 TetR/AcrR family transcriptional regulator [Ardenticatenaceae bacterium]MCB9003412.1 TetR/AcrR family transcriptional regulator [Ardenticatenaceae bacterium]